MKFKVVLCGLLVQLIAGLTHVEFGPQKRIELEFEDLLGEELAPLLSKDAVIVLPSSPRWDQLIARSSSPRIEPAYKVIVEVATEEDIQQTIRFANYHNVPFLAISGTHGWQTTLNTLKGGVQINMRKMNQTQISSGGKTATVGGGIMQYEIVAALWQDRKQAVTGLCECVSVIGPLLGGGHSLLQGRHGFSADNLVSARVVLADGNVVTTSEHENSDLFWALQGAGHNFGIVSSFEVNVYDASIPWKMFVAGFTQGSLERFFNTWNDLEAKYANPGLLVAGGFIGWNADLDPDSPVLNLQLLWEGENPIAEDYMHTFLDLKPPFSQLVPDIPWGSIYSVGGYGRDTNICRKNFNLLGFPNSIGAWNSTAMREGFSLFAELTSDSKFSTSAWILESYGRNAVQEVPDDKNAVAPEERMRHLLTSPLMWWDGHDEAHLLKAIEYGQKIQAALRVGTESIGHAYVNYAVGNEPLAETYGWDEKRISKLKRLKKKWDPNNRFGFYVPLE